jgi:hypothetical protein
VAFYGAVPVTWVHVIVVRKAEFGYVYLVFVGRRQPERIVHSADIGDLQARFEEPIFLAELADDRSCRPRRLAIVRRKRA